MDRLIGQTIGGYRIEAELGRGGQAVVYRATQLSLQRTVALKVVSPELSSDANYQERFTREGIAAASLDHPHVIPVYEAGKGGEFLYLAMKFIDGPSLDELLRHGGGIAARRALAVLRHVAEALDYMAERGLVHRDVKPANILLGPGDHAYLSDFGLIKAVSAARLTSPGVWMGTLEYVSPEQIRGADVTPAADRYALACLAFEAFTGQVPFPREDRTAALFAHVNDEPPSASSINPQMNAAVDAVLAHGLAKTPEQRPASASEFVAQLTAAVGAAGAWDSTPPTAADPVAPPTPAPTVTDGPLAAGAAAPAPLSPPPPPPPPPPAGIPAPPTAAGTPSTAPPARGKRIGIAAVVAAAAVVVVLVALLAAGVFSGDDAPRTASTDGPRTAAAEPVLPIDVPGWEMQPIASPVANITPAPDARTATAQYSQSNRIALVAGFLLPNDLAAADAFTALGSTIGGRDIGAPDLESGSDGGWLRAVVDGHALAFHAGRRVFLVLASDEDTARALGQSLSGG